MSHPVSVQTPDFDLLPSDIESDLRATVRDLLADRCPPDTVLKVYDGDRTLVPTLWRSVAVELGIAGLLVPEDLGGAGASAREAATVLEELGRACAPVPFLTSSVIATLVLLDAADGANAVKVRELLAELAAGERTAALVVGFATAPDGALPDLAGGPDPLTGSLAGSLTGSVAGPVAGEVRSVAGVLEADVLLVPVRNQDRTEVHLVERAEASVQPVVSLDMTRQLADVRFDDAVAFGPDTLLLADGEASVRSALLCGAALLASEQVGVARWCLETTVDYLKVRRQFGRVVGGFQALKHRLADLFAGVETASATARFAAAAVAEGVDVPIAARVGAAYTGDIVVHAAEEAIQLHGGIGMTWEHAAHLYLKKAKADQIGLGGSEAHRSALAPLIGITL